MSNIKTTAWFDGAKFVPAHVGVYQTEDRNFVDYQYWNGKFWGYYCGSASAAFNERRQSVEQNIHVCNAAFLPHSFG